VKDLLKVNPSAAKFEDWEGCLPLHDAGRQGNNIGLEAAKILLKTYPKGIYKVNQRGELPLLVAARSSSLETVKLFIHAWPAGGKHVLMRLRESDGVANWEWEILELLLRGAVNMLVESDKLSRHDGGVRFRQQVQASSNDHPSLLERRGHKRTYSQVSNGIMIAQSFSFSDSPTKPTTLHHFDFDYDCLVPCPHPKEECKECDEKSRTLSNDLIDYSALKFRALHAALTTGACLPILNRILITHGEDVKERDHYGRTVLHLAAEYFNRGIEANVFIWELLQRFPEAAELPDTLGRLPFHTALYHRADLNVLQLIKGSDTNIEFQPLETPDQYANHLPVIVAMCQHCDLDVMYTLLRNSPEIINQYPFDDIFIRATKTKRLKKCNEC